MTHAPSDRLRVLAVDPISRGVGYAILEGCGHLVEWGVSHTRRANNAECLKRVAALIAQYDPEVLVLEDNTDPRCRRRPRVRDLLIQLKALATTRQLRCCRISWRAVRKRFGDVALTKYAIAERLADRFPELAIRLPPRRKAWVSEDVRMSLFEAVALALAGAERAGRHSAATLPLPHDAQHV